MPQTAFGIISTIVTITAFIGFVAAAARFCFRVWAVLQNIAKEFTPNGGNSLRDRVNGLEARQTTLESVNNQQTASLNILLASDKVKNQKLDELANSLRAKPPVASEQK